MILCPECRRSYPGRDAPSCLHCGWTLEYRDGHPIMLSSRDRDDPMFAGYIGNYDEIAEEDLRESIQPESYLDAQASRLADLIGDVRGLDVCDLGVGQGRMVLAALAGGAGTVTGVDIATRYLTRLAGSGANLVVANAENLPFSGEFDVIIASEILEHVLNLGDLLISANEALRPEGMFVVRVPHREDLRQYGMLQDGHYRFVHLRAFTRDLLALMLEQAGFSVRRFALDGFYRDRVRPIFRRNERISGAVDRYMDRHYPTERDVHRIDPRLGLVLLEPVELTAVAYKGPPG